MPEDESFIALSYCWHNPQWTPLAHGPKNALRSTSSGPDIPISATLCEALFAERVSPNEGIWIDQLCIDQGNQEEKVQAIGAMDAIYRNASLVVIVLEDILINTDEAAILDSWIRCNERKEIWDPYKTHQSLERMAALMWKIFSARWFTRAWCIHELRVGMRHLFLISLEDARGNPGLKVLKITSEFLHEMCLMEAYLAGRVSGYESADNKSRYKNRLSEFSRHVRDVAFRRAQEASARASDDGRAQEDDGGVTSIMRVFAEVFQHASSVVTDKLAIVLDIVGCGLFYCGSTTLTAHECCYVFYHLALAAGDPTLLTLCGEKLKVNGSAASWMSWPRARDILDQTTHTLSCPRLDGTEIPIFDHREIMLDMVFLGVSPTSLHHPTAASRAKATEILRLTTGLFSTGHVLNSIDRSRNCSCDCFIEILACCLDCGADWIIESCRLRNESTASDIQFIQAINFFCNSYEYRPLATLSERKAEESSQIALLLEDEYIYQIASLLDWLAVLLRADDDGSNSKARDMLPAWIQSGPGESDRSLMLYHQSSLKYIRPFYIAIPLLLVRPEHSHLNRLWFISQENPQGASFAGSFDGGGSNEHSHVNDTEEWVVLNKASSFGTADFSRTVERPCTPVRIGRRLKICG